MPLLSTRLEFVSTSATAKIHNLILKKQNAGESIINLSVGESDFDTPRNIQKAAHTAIINGKTRYTSTDGLDRLKVAISNKLLRENLLKYEKKELIIAAGGKQVIFNALIATLNPNDEVIIPSPYWVSYPDIVNLCNGKPIIIPTDIKNNFKIKPNQLKKSVNSNTKWIIFNSPSNPSGSVYTEEELIEFCQILDDFPHINIMSDDIYEHIIFDGLTFKNVVQVNPSLKNRTLLVNGVSKAYAMTGWRIGYGASNETLIKAMTIIQSQSTSNASSISQHAAIEALENTQEFTLKNKVIYQNRRDKLITILSKSKFIEVVKPMGSFYAFPSIQKLIGRKSINGNIIKSDKEFVIELLNETGVAVVPGSAFGLKNTFRISFAVTEALLEEACSLIVDFVDSLKCGNRE